jgi:hypothetical protein
MDLRREDTMDLRREDTMVLPYNLKLFTHILMPSPDRVSLPASFANSP